MRNNGQDAGILWSIPFTTRIGKLLNPGLNTIEIEVSNLMANRIRQMDQQKVQWRIFHEFRQVNQEIKIAWHTCGAIRPLIPEFIELGLDFLNPIQPMASNMEPESLSEEFGRSISFFGGICVQDLLPNRTPEQIREEVTRRAKIMGNHGGYIIAPAHNVQDDTPEENILTMLETVRSLSI